MTGTRICSQGLDFCLAEMAKRNMRGILFLSNYWQWSGSFAQYVRWITGETIPDPDRPVMATGDWGGFMQFSARFYTTPGGRMSFIATTSRTSSSAATPSTAGSIAMTRPS